MKWSRSMYFATGSPEYASHPKQLLLVGYRFRRRGNARARQEQNTHPLLAFQISTFLTLEKSPCRINWGDNAFQIISQKARGGAPPEKKRAVSSNTARHFLEN